MLSLTINLANETANSDNQELEESHSQASNIKEWFLEVMKVNFCCGGGNAHGGVGCPR
jgi:hypothetical protein